MPTPPQDTPEDAPPVGLYADAMVYDILHAPGTAAEIDALERLAARHVRTRRARLRWLEPACGSGRCVRLAARRGTPCTGFDLDGGMVAYANERIDRAGLSPAARCVVADMRTFVDDGAITPNSFEFAFNTINSFRHLMSDRDALAHLEQTARALRPGGVYAVGLSTTAYGLEFPSEDVWTGARGPVRVTQTVQYVPPAGKTGGARMERVFSHLLIERPSGEEHRDSTYALRAYSLDQWLDLVARSPFEILETTDHDGVPCEAGESGYRVFVLGLRA
jgi:SAM-dependent methyltransferase